MKMPDEYREPIETIFYYILESRKNGAELRRAEKQLENLFKEYKKFRKDGFEPLVNTLKAFPEYTGSTPLNRNDKRLSAYLKAQGIMLKIHGKVFQVL